MIAYLHTEFVRLALLPFEDESPVNPEKVDAGLLGLAWFLGLGTAVILLVLSMRKHLRRVDVTRHQRETMARSVAAAKAAQAGPPPTPPAAPAAPAPAAQSQAAPAKKKRKGR